MTDETTTAAPPIDTPAPETPAPAPFEVPKSPPGAVNNPYIWGTGRRKTAVARVRIRPGTGKFTVNKKDVDQFFGTDGWRQAVRTPLKVTDSLKSVDVFVNVRGGGPSGQAGAVLLGVARALLKANPDYLGVLRKHQLLTRDPREVERKKYGRRGARRRFQFSKR
jgi:small subunit ribosomal protein S9